MAVHSDRLGTWYHSGQGHCLSTAVPAQSVDAVSHAHHRILSFKVAHSIQFAVEYKLKTLLEYLDGA